MCKLKLDKVEMMMNMADELECFDWLVEAGLDELREMKENMGDMDGEDGEDKGDKKGKKGKKGGKGGKAGKGGKGGKDEEDGEWEVDFDDLDVDDFLEEFGIEFDDLKRMKMRDIIREIGPCQRCKDDGCLRVNHWIGTKMMLVKSVMEKVEEWGGCPAMSSKGMEGTTAGTMTERPRGP